MDDDKLDELADETTSDHDDRIADLSLDDAIAVTEAAISGLEGRLNALRDDKRRQG